MEILCTNGVKSVMLDLIPAFERAGNTKVATTWGSTNALLKDLESGAGGDVAILTAEAIDVIRTVVSENATIAKVRDLLMGALLSRNGSRILGLPVFGVVDRLPEAAPVGFLVHLGASRLTARAHHEHHRLLAAHELAHDALDEAFLDERLEAGGNSQLRPRGSWRPRDPSGPASLRIPLPVLP